jgi:hypothetical protein
MAIVLCCPLLRAIAGVITLLALIMIGVAIAEERRPMPVPQIGSGCPPGFSSSPT